MSQTLTYPLLLSAAKAILEVIDSYTSKGAPTGERRLDPVLFAFLRGKGTQVDRQVPVTVAGQKRRIDFRCKGTNPANVEWAVRPNHGGPQLRANSNGTEIKKLSRTPNARRYLLLLDLTDSKQAWNAEDLASDYKGILLGPGKYQRHSVTVVYVHRNVTFKYIWKP